MYLLKLHWVDSILGDPWADSGDEEKSKRAEKYMARRKVKNGREEPLGTMSYQTSSKQSPPFWVLIGARKLVWVSEDGLTLDPYLFEKAFC